MPRDRPPARVTATPARWDAAGTRSAVLRLATKLAWLLTLALVGCGGGPAPQCTIDDLGDHMVSTKQVFLERLAGCPIGGRD
jgi:hypothetical protein